MTQAKDLLHSMDGLSAPQLRRLLTEQLTKQKLVLYWEASTELQRGIAAPVCK